jgi:hypothetical protein
MGAAYLPNQVPLLHLVTGRKSPLPLPDAPKTLLRFGHSPQDRLIEGLEADMGHHPGDRRVEQPEDVEERVGDPERLRRRAAVLRELARARNMMRGTDTMAFARMLVARRQYRH